MKINHQLLKNHSFLPPSKRLHQIPCPIFAITGGIATGKSSVVRFLLEHHQPIIQADQLIKSAYQKVEIVQWLLKTTPQVFKNDQIDFSLLRSQFFNDPKFKEEAEKKLYAQLPSLFREGYNKLPSASYVFYEVPLLFEKKLAHLVDLIILVHAPRDLQSKRLALRDSSCKEVNEKILNAQLPFEDKKEFAHFIIENDTDEAALKNQVEELLQYIHKITNTSTK